MFYSEASHSGQGRIRSGTVQLMGIILLSFVLTLGCGILGKTVHPGNVAYTDRVSDLRALALWFAPVLYFNPDEPSAIITVIPVFHPSEPMVAYHVFLEDDAFMAGRGKMVDHEVVWVGYDPVSLKVADVLTLWHRTVLRTDACVVDAKARDHRPRICVQWGQHGMLPFGWETLTTVRPRAELNLHYNLAKYINRVPLASPADSALVFEGSYEDYVTFTREVDTAVYINEQDIAVAEDCSTHLSSLIEPSFSVKKQWPQW